jgi:hypothetical protein
MKTVRRGVIYVLANRYMPGLLKIGQTTRDPEVRAREISRSTGVPDDFEIIFDEIVSDVDGAESAIHAQLAKHRVNKLREFFQVDFRTGIKVVRRVCEAFAVDEESDAEGIEILPPLERRMRRWLRRELVSVEFVQFSDLCILRVTEQPDIKDVDAFQTAVDLRIFGTYGGDEDLGDDMLFSPQRTLRENVGIFLDLDPYSMIMTDLGLLSDEASDYVAHLVEKVKIEPPTIPGWRVCSIKYDLWGSAVMDNEPLLKWLRDNDSRRLEAPGHD